MTIYKYNNIVILILKPPIIDIHNKYNTYLTNYNRILI
jgi:hypothetical protein